MPPHLKAGLTTEAASRICMRQCRAQCCRGPLVLQLNREEVSQFRDWGNKLGVKVVLDPAPDGGGRLRFLDHAGEHCPFLDDDTSACRVYASRPQRCRNFPERPTPGCAISGGA